MVTDLLEVAMFRPNLGKKIYIVLENPKKLNQELYILGNHRKLLYLYIYTKYLQNNILQNKYKQNEIYAEQDIYRTKYIQN